MLVHFWKLGAREHHDTCQMQLQCQWSPAAVMKASSFPLHIYFCSTRVATITPAFWGYPPSPHDYPHYWIPSQKNNQSRTENVTEQTRFSKSRSNDLEDIGQGQRSSHATHLLMLVIICTKYGKNPSRTVDATERTRFSRSRPNDLEDIGQGQRSLYATHPLMLVIICAKYGKNPSRIVDFFFQGQGQKV